MGTSKLTNKQVALINDVKEEIELYKLELENQIKNSKFNMYLGIVIIIVVAGVIYFKPDFLAGFFLKFEDVSEKFDLLGIGIGEGLPMLFSLKSLNISKDRKKRLNGVRIFEKDLTRMEEGIITNGEEHILTLEKEFLRYINT